MSATVPANDAETLDATLPALGVVAEELARLAALAEALELPVAGLIARAGPLAAAAYPQVQQLDLFAQSLRALAIFTAGLAQGFEATDAAGSIGLADLAARLTGADPDPRKPDSPAGECAFFVD